MIKYLTNLRAFAILAVIILHTVAPLMHKWITHTWWVGNIIDSSVRWSVPIFVMVSGALLLGKNESLGIFFKKRFLKIGIPFIFWVTFYIFWSYRGHFDSLTLSAFIKLFFGGQPFFHLWFLYMIVGVYFMTPILRLVAKPENKPFLLYFLGIWAVIGTLFPVIGHYFGYKVGFSFDFFTGFTGFFLLGYYLHHFPITKKVERLFYVLGILSWLFTILATYFDSKYSHHFNDFWLEYLFINTIFISIGLFLFAKKRLNHWSPAIIKSISKMSFGIYLVHPIFLTIFSSQTFHKWFGFNLNCFFINPIVGTILSFLALVVCSSIVCYVIQKTPLKILLP